jgi:hypothetical protein
MKDGGQAFPVNITTLGSSELRSEITHGMTLRDYFAAKAMQALLLQEVDLNQPQEDGRNIPYISYSISDAMLKARGDQ